MNKTNNPEETASKLYRQRNGGYYSLTRDLLGFYDVSVTVPGPGGTAVKLSTCPDEANVLSWERQIRNIIRYTRW